jgi:dUTP pyrophosphatase
MTMELNMEPKMESKIKTDTDRFEATTGFDRLRVKRMHPEAVLPTRAHADDAGMDLYSLEDVVLDAGQGRTVRSGIAIALPVGTVALVADRSSMAKRGFKTAGGVIDAGYRGEIHIVLWNISQGPLEIKKGERLAQLLIYPILTPQPVEVEELDSTVRGAKGFGSSGK